MERSHIVKFLKEKRRGVYKIIVEQYIDTISSNSVITLALEIIKEDLERSTNEKIGLNYFSLAQAISEYKKKNRETVKSPTSSGNKVIGKDKYQFKDAHEIITDESMKPGSFNIKDKSK